MGLEEMAKNYILAIFGCCQMVGYLKSIVTENKHKIKSKTTDENVNSVLLKVVIFNCK